MSIGKLFLAALIETGTVADLMQFGPVDHLFKATEKEAYQFVKEFVKQYQKLPEPETIKAHTGEVLPPPKEPAAYYADLMKIRYTELELKSAMQKAAGQLAPDVKDVEGALATMTESIMELMANQNTHKIVDFRDAYDAVMAEYAAKWNHSDEYGLRIGWPTLDQMTGGLGKGDVLSFVGRPAAGKTFQMLYGAMHGWVAAGTSTDPEVMQSRMFVSMEMPISQIRQRLASMVTHVPAGQLKHAQLSTKKLKVLKEGLTEVQGFGSPFYIVDGNLTATVEDIYMLARQLAPDAIFIDGGYLVKHPTERDRYRRVAENADLIKQELAALAPTAVSWQFAKSASKKKKGEKVTGDDVGYSDAIFQVASVMLGLFEEDSVETLKKRNVEILKGRGGEVGSFSTRWDFQNMDFTEIEETAVEDLQFL